MATGPLKTSARETPFCMRSRQFRILAPKPAGLLGLLFLRMFRTLGTYFPTKQLSREVSELLESRVSFSGSSSRRAFPGGTVAHKSSTYLVNRARTKHSLEAGGRDISFGALKLCSSLTLWPQRPTQVKICLGLGYKSQSDSQ